MAVGVEGGDSLDERGCVSGPAALVTAPIWTAHWGVVLVLARHVRVSRGDVAVVGAALDLGDGDVDVEGGALVLALGHHADLAAVELHDRV